MIHAYLFITEQNQDRDGHGPNFQVHMDRINNACNANITVFHNFNDEVDHYRTHWWECKVISIQSNIVEMQTNHKKINE
jgi:hypothetical protein